MRGTTENDLNRLLEIITDIAEGRYDEKTAALKERFTKWGTAEDAFTYWADRLRAFLDASHSEAKIEERTSHHHQPMNSAARESHGA